MSSYVGRIAAGGMGGFLNPPGHPEHDWHVEGYRGDCASLSSCVNSTASDWSERVRKQAAAKLADWVKLPLSSPAVDDWVRQVLGYFRGCYVGADGNRIADKLHMFAHPPGTELANAATHAGVLFILDFYPDYLPQQADFDSAYWGTRPE